MHLTDLIRKAGLSQSFELKNDHQTLEIKGLGHDSRKIAPGDIFIALPGHAVDGRDYIDAALKAGAVAVMVPEGTHLTQDIPVLQSTNIRSDLSALASAFYSEQPGHVVAVTGTNGKTSVANFVRQIWQLQGKDAASLGTIGLQRGDRLNAGSLTTPDPIALHRDISEATKDGVSHLAIEASSHGLDQYRLHGLRIQAAGFTNLTHEHLDYHKTFENYREAKARLFAELLPESALAVINADSDQAEYYKDVCHKRDQRVITYGHASNDLKILKREPHPAGQHAEIMMFGKPLSLSLPLVGAFQLMNFLCASVLACDPDISLKDQLPDIFELAPQIQSVRGRLQLVSGHPQNAAIYVDYAHTPDALETVLKALRPHTKGKLVCVVGCGGDRDKKKRPMMGKIADRLADTVVITDDNPRTEDPAVIRAEMLEGAADALEIYPRDRAIQDSVAMLKDGDVLLIAGKGHEQGQIIGAQTHPFDDVAHAEGAIRNLK